MEKKTMHDPVITERLFADRGQVSPKTLRRWRLDHEAPVRHMLFHLAHDHDHDHEADGLEFERQSPQHWPTILSENACHAPSHTHQRLANVGCCRVRIQYLSAKDVVEAIAAA